MGYTLALLCSLFFSAIVNAAAADPAVVSSERPVVSIIIDDLGDNLIRGRQVVGLPGPVACAFLPHRPYSRNLAETAHHDNKEVLLHLPMEPMEEDQHMGPGGLTLDMTEPELDRVFTRDLQAVPYAIGVNNHMGSLLTRHPGHMTWLMRAIYRHGQLFFVDSFTTGASVAGRMAAEMGVPNVQRDVFLDHRRERRAIAYELQRLVKMARRNGAALAIGHPYPETLELLEDWLPKLDDFGVQLVSLSEFVQRQQSRSVLQWRASLSPLQAAVKNSKPSPSSICCAGQVSR